MTYLHTTQGRRKAIEAKQRGFLQGIHDVYINGLKNSPLLGHLFQQSTGTHQEHGGKCRASSLGRVE